MKPLGEMTFFIYDLTSHVCLKSHFCGLSQVAVIHVCTLLTHKSLQEEDAIKLLSKTTKAQQRAELLLSEIGFTDQVSEYRVALKAKRSGEGTSASTSSKVKRVKTKKKKLQ